MSHYREAKFLLMSKGKPNNNEEVFALFHLNIELDLSPNIFVFAATSYP